MCYNLSYRSEYAHSYEINSLACSLRYREDHSGRADLPFRYSYWNMILAMTCNNNMSTKYHRQGSKQEFTASKRMEAS
jgi:hypothetical protein